MRACGCPDEVLADIALCVSELVTNCIKHTLSGAPGGYFTVTIHVNGTAVRVEVADLAPDRASLPPGNADGGWGLQPVSVHATRMGQMTWFECDWGSRTVSSLSHRKVQIESRRRS